MLPLATNKATLLETVTLVSVSDLGFVAVAGLHKVDIYDTRVVDARLDLRRQPMVFSTNTIPAKNVPDERITAILLHQEYLWVGSVDGALRAWHWPSNRLIFSFRRTLSRVVQSIKSIRSEVSVAWSTRVITVFQVLNGRVVLKENVADPPLYNELETINNEFLLAYNQSMLQVAPLDVESNYRAIKCDLQTNILMAATAAVLHDDRLHVYTALALADHKVLLSHFRPQKIYEETGPRTTTAFVKDELVCSRHAFYPEPGSSVNAMVMFQNHLIVGMTLAANGKDRPSVQFCCPQRLTCLRVIVEPTLPMRGAVVLNRGCPQETLLTLSRLNQLSFTRLVVPKWAFSYSSVFTAILCSKHYFRTIPRELWLNVLQFL